MQTCCLRPQMILTLRVFRYCSATPGHTLRRVQLAHWHFQCAISEIGRISIASQRLSTGRRLSRRLIANSEQRKCWQSEQCLPAVEPEGGCYCFFAEAARRQLSGVTALWKQCTAAATSQSGTLTCMNMHLKHVRLARLCQQKQVEALITTHRGTETSCSAQVDTILLYIYKDNSCLLLY